MRWLGAFILFQLATAYPIYAQVVADDTLSTIVNVTESSFEITGGARRSGNLFHSFDTFSIQNGEVADFQLPQNSVVENIFSRVTGGSISSIDGILRARGNANFFLINPSGIIFGPNAVLDVNASFFGSTANSVTFMDGVVFRARAEASPLLTMSTPQGVQFESVSGSIINQSNATPNGERTLFGNPVGLRVQPGNTLVLVGGDVISEGGHFTAQQGRIEIGSVESGFVGIDMINQGWALDYENVNSFRDIRLGPLEGNNSLVNANGVNGTVRLRGRNVELVNTPIFSFVIDEGDGGFLEVFATETLELEGTSSVLVSQVGFDPSIEVVGDGGDIFIQAKQFSVRDGGIVSSGTNSIGAAGDITINASEFVEISGTGETITPVGPMSASSVLTTATGSSGAGGILTINTSKLEVRDGGDIVVQSFGPGPAGELNINSDKVILEQGNLTAATFFSDGGNINLRVSDLLLLSNGSQITAAAGGQGNGGNVAIDAGVIFAVSNQNNDIIASAVGGDGGNIPINAQLLLGLQERPAVPNNGTNDLDASSEFGLAGGVEINTIISDPDAGLVTLPEAVGEISQKIAVGCAAKQGNRFVLIGRGGVPTTPQELISNSRPWKDTRDLSAFRTSKQKNLLKGYRKKEVITSPSTLIEATGWHRDVKGKLRLVISQPSLQAGEPTVKKC